MPATLKIRTPGGDAFEVEVGNTTTIGRSRDNTVSLHSSPHVSRQHAIIRCHNGYQFQIMDLGSRNGTFVNGRRVVTPTILAHGAVIRISDNELLFEHHESVTEDAFSDLTIAAGTDTASDQTAIVAVMVCDIRGFSTISEATSEEKLARALGEWFRDAGNIIHACGGTVDKFMGDAVLAYWTCEASGGNECQRALDGAQRLLAAAATRHWAVASQEAFAIAVALHHGLVTCGNIGIVAQRDATIIGDTVNTVFRIEGVMKQLNQKLVASGDFVKLLGEAASDFRELGEFRLKGKHHPVTLYGLA